MKMENKRAHTKYPSPFSLRPTDEEREELGKLAEGQPLGKYIKYAIFSRGLRLANTPILYIALMRRIAPLNSV